MRHRIRVCAECNTETGFLTSPQDARHITKPEGVAVHRQIEACTHIEKAAELDPRGATPHVTLAQIYMFLRDFEKANAEADAALALNPKDAVFLANLGSMRRYIHRAGEAADVLERAIRLDPFHPANYLEWLGDADFLLERLDDCVETVEWGIVLEADFVALHVVAAKCYAALREEERAKQVGSEVLRNNPCFTLRAFASYVPFSDERDLQRNIEMLRIAGLPECGRLLVGLFAATVSGPSRIWDLGTHLICSSNFG